MLGGIENGIVCMKIDWVRCAGKSVVWNVGGILDDNTDTVWWKSLGKRASVLGLCVSPES